MVSSSTLLLGAAALLGLGQITPVAAGTGDHFILTRLFPLSLARVDPIVNPGAVSGHVHNVVGGSCFGADPNNPQEQENCDCSSVIVNDDMSNYWAPALYHQSADGKFSPMMGLTRTYYFVKGKDVKPFPKGMRMITGMAMKRDASDYKTDGVRISCNHGEQTKFLPNGTSHPNGCTAISMGISSQVAVLPVVISILLIIPRIWLGHKSSWEVERLLSMTQTDTCVQSRTRSNTLPFSWNRTIIPRKGNRGILAIHSSFPTVIHLV